MTKLAKLSKHRFAGFARFAWIAAIVIFAPSPSAGADDPTASPPAEAAPAAHGIEEIVVTARKTAESLQDVPVAVTALSEQKLEQTSTTSTIDLQFQVPNMTAREGNFSSTAAVFQIRGQVQV